MILTHRVLSSALALAAISLAAVPAKAGLLLEPYIGYQAAGSFSYKFAGAKSAATQSGTAIGGRIGYSLPLIFWFGLDGRQTTGKVKTTEGGNGDGDMTETQLGASVGANLPLIRAYAGYLFMNDLKATGTSGSTTFVGQGLKVGAGFTGFPFISINAEYVMSTYSKAKETTEFSIDEGVGNSITLSVSAPFDI